MRMAVQKGLLALSITDHDTIEGARLAETIRTDGAPFLLTGVEISTQAPARYAVNGSLHILGYGIDPNHQPLIAALDQLRQARDDRTPQIVQRLNQLGLDLSLEQVQAEIGDGTPGRPHIASVMVKAGMVSSINEAFDRYLGKNRPGYVDKERLDCGLAMDLIRKAGGVPVLAHPYLIQCDPQKGLISLVDALCEMGLGGIEAYYSQHPPEVVDFLINLAQERDLLITGGTDFHGKVTPDIELGTGEGGLHVPFELYEKLKYVLDSMEISV
jgi:predicted metal-dependent phosphoesterase TrpH